MLIDSVIPIRPQPLATADEMTVRDYSSRLRLKWPGAGAFIGSEAPYTRARIMEIRLNSQEASLLTAFRRLPPEAAGELSRLIERLAALAPERKIDWSDSWSDDDLQEFRAASVRRLEESESEDKG